MKNSKTCSLILAAILLLALVPEAFAITSAFSWSDGSTSKSINFGISQGFTVEILTNYPPISILALELRDAKNNLVENIPTADEHASKNVYYDSITLSSADYKTSGVYTVRLNAKDNRGETILKEITLVVNEAVPEMRSQIPDKSFPEDTQGTINLNDYFYDPDNDPLTFSVEPEKPQNLGIEIKNGVATITPDANWNGQRSVEFIASDGNKAHRSNKVKITVTPVNDNPDAADDAKTVSEDSMGNTINVLANDKDIEGDTLSISGLSQPSHGTANHYYNNVYYTPNKDYAGTDSLTYTISDGHGGTDTATVSITVTPADDAPVANGDSFTVDEDASNVQLDVLANDNDADTAQQALTIKSTSAPAHGTLFISADKKYAVYTPAGNYNGPDSFTYIITDGNFDSQRATVSITVRAINDNPQANADAKTVAGNSQNNVIDVLANDFDIDGDALTITQTGVALHGAVTVKSNKIEYTPNTGYYGADAFEYTITDGKSGTGTAAVSITVTKSNSPPVAGMSISPKEDIFTGDMVSYDGSASSDPEHDELTYHWKFGDGYTADGVKVTHVYTQPGIYTINLTVTEKNTPEHYRSIALKQITVEEKKVSQLQVSSLDCFPIVIINEKQSCSVKVTADGKPVADATVNLYFLDAAKTPYGPCDKPTNSITGGCNAEKTMTALGDFIVYATASKTGYASDTDTAPQFTFKVFDKRYDIVELDVFSDAGYTKSSREFFRGENMYVQFKVFDTKEQKFVRDIVTAATLVSEPGGRAQLSKQTPTGDSYRYALTPIPLSHDFKGDSQVFTFAFNFKDQSGGQREVTLLIKNNPPKITPQIPDIACTVGNDCTLNLSDHETDKEDAGQSLLWSVAGVNTALFTASINEKILTIHPIAKGTDPITLTLSDLDRDSASQDITVSISAKQNNAPRFAQKEQQVTIKELEQLRMQIVAIDDDTPQPKDVYDTTPPNKNKVLQYELVNTNIPVPPSEWKWIFSFTSRNIYEVDWKPNLKQSGTYYFDFKVYDPLSGQSDTMRLNLVVEDFNILNVYYFVGLGQSQPVNEGDTLTIYELDQLYVRADVRDPQKNEILVPSDGPVVVLVKNAPAGFDTVVNTPEKTFPSITVTATYQGVEFSKTFNVKVKDLNKYPAVKIISPKEGEVITKDISLVGRTTKGDSDIIKENMYVAVRESNSFGTLLYEKYIGDSCTKNADGSVDCTYTIPTQKTWPQDLRVILRATDVNGGTGLDFVNVKYSPTTPKLTLTKLDCFNPVAEGKEQSCSVAVTSDGAPVAGSVVKAFFADNTPFGECTTGVNDQFNGGCAIRRVMPTKGTVNIYALATKAGYENSNKLTAQFDVFEEGYKIEELASYGDTSYAQAKTKFLRGEILYIKFKVTDKFTGKPVTEIPTSATLDNKFTGQKLDLNADGRDGLYYKFNVQIPPDHRFKGDTEVFTFAINFAEKKMGQDTITITIFNNPVKVDPIPDLTCELGKVCDFDLTKYASDVEDAPDKLVWDAFPGTDSDKFFDAKAVRTGVVRITPKTEGKGKISIGVTDLDNARTNGKANVIITKSIVISSKLTLTKLDCFNPVVEGKEQSCSVAVTSDGVPVAGSVVKAFFADNSAFGECTTGVNDNFNGGCAIRRVMPTKGSVNIYAYAIKAGYENSNYLTAQFDVFEEGYLIKDLKPYGDAGYSVVQTEFFRGQNLYIKFRVADKITGNYVRDVVTSATLDNKYTGQKLNLNADGMDGDFYKFKVQIPPDHRFKDETQVFTFAINFQTKKGGEEIITIKIKNNLPTLAIPPLSCEATKTCTFGLSQYGNDIEDGKNLAWGVSGASGNLFTAAITGKDTLTITAKDAVGMETISISAADLDVDTASQNVAITIFRPQVSVVQVDLTFGVSSGSGTVTASYFSNSVPQSQSTSSSATVKADKDTAVTLTATPSANYAFSSWSDGVTSSSRSFIIASNTVLTANFAQTFQPVNNAPVITSSPITSATVNFQYTYDVEATDPGDTLTYSLTTSPSGMSINSQNGLISWVPTSSQIGSNPVTVQVSDGKVGGIATQSFSITVFAGSGGGNRAPSAESFSVSTNEDTPTTFGLRCSDPDTGDSTTAIVTTTPTYGSLVPVGGSQVQYTPHTNFNGGDSFTYKCRDTSNAESGIATVSIFVGALNDAPVFTSSPITTAEAEKSYTYDVNAVDPEGSVVTYSLVKGPRGMTIEPQSGIVSWSPGLDDVASHLVIISASDGTVSATQSYTLTVRGVPNALRKDLIVVKDVKLPSDLRSFTPGEWIPVEVSFSNEGNVDVKNAVVSLGFYDHTANPQSNPRKILISAGSKASMTRRIYLEAPEAFIDGEEYYLRIISSNVNTRGETVGPLFFR